MNRTPSAVNPLPWIVWALALPLIAMELVLTAGESGLIGGGNGIAWRGEAVQTFGFVPDLLRGAWARGQYLPDEPWRLFSYVLVHGSFTNTLFAVVILLALGKMVGEIFRWWAVAVIWFGASVLGVVVYTLVLPANSAWFFGAFPADYGLIGAFTFLLWMRLAGTGSNQYRAFTMIGLLMFVQLVFGLLFGGGYGWVAELAGFVTGFLLSFVVSPGGWRQVMLRLRRR